MRVLAKNVHCSNLRSDTLSRYWEMISSSTSVLATVFVGTTILTTRCIFLESTNESSIWSQITNRRRVSRTVSWTHIIVDRARQFLSEDFLRGIFGRQVTSFNKIGPQRFENLSGRHIVRPFEIMHFHPCLCDDAVRDVCVEEIFGSLFSRRRHVVCLWKDLLLSKWRSDSIEMVMNLMLNYFTHHAASSLSI